MITFMSTKQALSTTTVITNVIVNKLLLLPWQNNHHHLSLHILPSGGNLGMLPTAAGQESCRGWRRIFGGGKVRVIMVVVTIMTIDWQWDIRDSSIIIFISEGSCQCTEWRLMSFLGKMAPNTPLASHRQVFLVIFHLIRFITKMMMFFSVKIIIYSSIPFFQESLCTRATKRSDFSFGPKLSG